MSSSVFEAPPAIAAPLEVPGDGRLLPGPSGLIPLPPREGPGPEILSASPGLEISPIGAAYRPVSRLASLGGSVLAWALLGGLGLLGYQMREGARPALAFPTQAMSFQLNDTDAVTPDGGGHAGGGLPPLKAAEPEPAPATPPPPPPRDLPADIPAPSALPSEPAPAPPAPRAMGVPGGTGTGNGYGTGSGSGSGTGGGSGSGNGSGAGIQSENAPVVVPYSQIRPLKVVNPEYPERARRAGLEGQAVVRVTIDENGVPFEFHVVGGEDMFLKEFLRVLPHWRFTPVLHQGRKVKATFDAVLRFNLA